MFAIKSSLEQKLLTYFFLNPHSKLYLQEIARILKLDPGNLDKTIKRLEKSGLFSSEFLGKQKYYFLNKKFPLFFEYQSIINKTFGVIPSIKKELGGLKNIKEAYLFGSFLTEKFDEFSDIDLFVVGDFNTIDLHKKINNLEKDFGREINVVEMKKSEFFKKKKENNEFLKHIFQNRYEKII